MKIINITPVYVIYNDEKYVTDYYYSSYIYNGDN
jgi:hypothetical protein